MKLTLDRVELTEAFGLVQRLVPPRHVRKDLLGVRLHSEAGEVSLQSGDGETSMCHRLPSVKANGDGVALLPTKRTSLILKELDAKVVSVECGRNGIRLWDDANEFTFAADEVSDLQPAPVFTEKSYFKVPAKAMGDAVTRTVMATDRESARYALGGIYCDFTDDGLTLVATDSRRLAMMPVPLTTRGRVRSKNTSPVILAKAMEILAVAASGDGDMNFVIRDKEAAFQFGNITLVSNLIEGRFPRYRDVIPKRFYGTAKLDAAKLKAAMSRARIMTTAECWGVDFIFSKDSLILNRPDREVGGAKFKIPLSYSGKDVAIWLNPRFLEEFASALPGETQVTFKVIAGEEPVMLMTDDGYRCVTMPGSRDDLS